MTDRAKKKRTIVIEGTVPGIILYAPIGEDISDSQLELERDNVIIRESIETFTGFVDAKDSYTNGHSKKVADYTRMIAQQMGYEGEELDCYCFSRLWTIRVA